MGHSVRIRGEVTRSPAPPSKGSRQLLLRARVQAHVRDPHPRYVRHAPKDQEDPPTSPSPPNPPWRIPPCQQGHPGDDQAFEPYVAYGYPSLKATRELIYKRGFGKKKTMGQAQRVTLNCNDDIEVALGDHGINCFEDLIHEIYTVGPAFKQANNFLWPFKLNSAKGGLPKKRLGFNEGGQCGNREQYMSSLIFRML